MEMEKAEKHGYEISNSDPAEIYAIQTPKDLGIDMPWVRVTRSRYVAHAGLSACGTLDEVKFAIADFDGVPTEAVGRATGYDNKASVRVDGFGFQFPASQLEQALDYTKRTGVSVSITNDASSEDAIDHRRFSGTLRSMQKLTKRKLISVDHCAMTIDDQWLCEGSTLCHNPELVAKKYAAKRSRSIQRSDRKSSGIIRRSRLDHEFVYAMYQICMHEVERNEIFQTTRGYYTCMPPLREDSPSSREGFTIAIWKLAKLCVLLHKKPLYRNGSWGQAHYEKSWWDCLNVLKAKNMKDACMRNQFEKFIKQEIKVMIRLKKVKPPPPPEKKPVG